MAVCLILFAELATVRIVDSTWSWEKRMREQEYTVCFFFLESGQHDDVNEPLTARLYTGDLPFTGFADWKFIHIGPDESCLGVQQS